MAAPRASESMHGLLGLPVKDLEYLLGDVLETLLRIDSKRSLLQGQIAAASRGKRRARRAPAASADVPVPVLPADRKGTSAIRRRLRATAGDVKKELKRLEAVWGDLEEALVDAKERRALQQGGNA